MPSGSYQAPASRIAKSHVSWIVCITFETRTQPWISWYHNLRIGYWLTVLEGGCQIVSPRFLKILAAQTTSKQDTEITQLNSLKLHIEWRKGTISPWEWYDCAKNVARHLIAELHAVAQVGSQKAPRRWAHTPIQQQQDHSWQYKISFYTHKDSLEHTDVICDLRCRY